MHYQALVPGQASAADGRPTAHGRRHDSGSGGSDEGRSRAASGILRRRARGMAAPAPRPAGPPESRAGGDGPASRRRHAPVSGRVAPAASRGAGTRATPHCRYARGQRRRRRTCDPNGCRGAARPRRDSRGVVARARAIRDRARDRAALGRPGSGACRGDGSGHADAVGELLARASPVLLVAADPRSAGGARDRGGPRAGAPSGLRSRPSVLGARGRPSAGSPALAALASRTFHGASRSPGRGVSRLPGMRGGGRGCEGAEGPGERRLVGLECQCADRGIWSIGNGIPARAGTTGA